MADVARTGEVVWYVTGRFFTDSNGNLFDIGYFLAIQGIEASLFSDPTMSEATAWFTFSAAPFSAASVDNGGLNIGVDATGSFSLYLLDAPGASFADTDTFSAGTCIATFSRVNVVPTTKVAVDGSATLLSNVFTAKLVSSTPFAFGGVTYDFAELVGFGITQWGTAATEAASAPGVPFLGSAIRVG